MAGIWRSSGTVRHPIGNGCVEYVCARAAPPNIKQTNSNNIVSFVIAFFLSYAVKILCPGNGLVSRQRPSADAFSPEYLLLLLAMPCLNLLAPCAK